MPVHRSLRMSFLSTLKLLLSFFNPQGGLWEQGTFAEHVSVPVRPAAPHLPDSDYEAHNEHH